MDKNDVNKRLYEIEKKQDLLITGILKAMEKLGIKEDDNLELFCVSTLFSYEDFEKFKLFLVESSVRLHNNNLTKVQFIDNYNAIFPNRKLLLPKLMLVIDKTDEFEQLRNLYFDRK